MSYREDDWGLILGALDEHAMSAIMGFVDHLKRPYLQFDPPNNQEEG